MYIEKYYRQDFETLQQYTVYLHWPILKNLDYTHTRKDPINFLFPQKFGLEKKSHLEKNDYK